MAGKTIEMTGRVYGRWEVLTPSSRKGYWRCRCQCAAKVEKDVDGGSLRRGQSTSCGCFQREDMSRRKTTHGQRRKVSLDPDDDRRIDRSPTYYSWSAMNARCYTTSDANYANYGGRGITVCARWRGRNGYRNFVEDMGERPEGKTIHRHNSDDTYYKENCSWALEEEQLRNRRDRSDERTAAIVSALESDTSVSQRHAVAMRFGVTERTVRKTLAKAAGKAIPPPRNNRRSSEYWIWNAMCRRCRDAGVERYGGRGISVCSRWLGKQGFDNFLADMGFRPTKDHTLGRMNNEGGYCGGKCGGVCGFIEEGNCKWESPAEQALNKQGVRQFTGEETRDIVAADKAGASLSAIGRKYSVGYQVIKRVLRDVRKLNRHQAP